MNGYKEDNLNYYQTLSYNYEYHSLEIPLHNSLLLTSWLPHINIRIIKYFKQIKPAQNVEFFKFIMTYT